MIPSLSGWDTVDVNNVLEEWRERREGEVSGEREKGKLGKEKGWRQSYPAGKYTRLSEGRAVSSCIPFLRQILAILGSYDMPRSSQQKQFTRKIINLHQISSEVQTGQQSPEWSST